jgi:hypothetical protein
VLGGLYGALIGGATFLVPVFTQAYPDVVMSETEESRSASAVLFFVTFIGGGVGAVVGAAMGLATGLILGAALAALTRAYFFTAPDPGAHRRAAGRAGAVAPLPLIFAPGALYGFDPATLVLLGLVSVLILSLVARFTGRLVAGWWAAVNRQRTRLA